MSKDSLDDLLTPVEARAFLRITPSTLYPRLLRQKRPPPTTGAEIGVQVASLALAPLIVLIATVALYDWLLSFFQPKH